MTEEQRFPDVTITAERVTRLAKYIDIIGRLTFDIEQETLIKYRLGRISDQIEQIAVRFQKQINVLQRKYGEKLYNDKDELIGIHVPVWCTGYDDYITEYDKLAKQTEVIKIPVIFPLTLKIKAKTVPSELFKYTDILFNGIEVIDEPEKVAES